MIRRVLAVALAVVVSGACSDGSSDDTASSTTSTVEMSTSTTSTNELGIDCQAVNDARLNFAGNVQLLANLVGPDQYDLIRQGAVIYDPVAMRGAIEALRPLESFETPLGSVQASLDIYDEANALAEINLAGDPFGPTGRGDELADMVADSAAFVAHQGPINFAIGIAGCN